MTTSHKNWRTWFRKDIFIRAVVVVGIMIVMFAEISVVVRDLHLTRDAGGLKPYTSTKEQLKIQPWMTFRYVNTLYDLPPAYLEYRLGIIDHRYPDIEIRRHARTKEVDPSILIEDIMQAINMYPGV